MPEAVFGTVNYLGPMAEPPVGYTHNRELGNFNLEPHRVRIRDLRTLDRPASLEREGCMLLEVPMEPCEGEDLAALAQRHAGLVLERLAEITGARKIASTAPLLRYSRPPDGAAASAANYIHCDWTEASFRLHLDRHIAEDVERDRWMAGRSAILQTWVALSPPPQDTPLTILDRSTMRPGDLIGPIATGSGWRSCP